VYGRKKIVYCIKLYQTTASLCNKTIPEERKCMETKYTRRKNVYGNKQYQKNDSLLL
jgi:hypothetical protein